MNKVYLNNRIVKKSEATFPADSTGLNYGAGCFETFRCYSGKLLHFEEHMDRLNSGLNYLGVGIKETPDTNEIRDRIHELLRENEIDISDAKIRIQVSIRNGGGFSTKQSHSYDVLIVTEPFEPKSKPVRICKVSTCVVPKVCRPTGHKLSNMLHYRNAFREAESRGYDDGLMLTMNGNVSETSIANVFWRTAGNVFTPSVSCDLLPGIMRKLVLNILADDMDYNVEEGEFVIDDVKNADEVWLTNSLREIRSVKSFDDVNFKLNTEFMSQLLNSLESYKQDHLV